MAVELTQKELSDVVGVSVQTLNDWKRSGLPLTKRKGSNNRTKCMFDVLAVLEWCAQNGRTKAAWRLKQKYFPNVSEEPIAPGELSEPTPLEQADIMVDDAFRRYKGCEGDLPGIAIEAQRAWAEAMNTRRQARNDHAKSEQALGAVMPVSEHDRQLYESHAIVAQALRGLSKQLPQKLLGKDARKMKQIIADAVRNCMHALASGGDEG